MKRAGHLYCAGVDAPRFKVLKQRGQLPYVIEADDLSDKWANYTLDQTFRLRLALDLIGGESKDESQLQGLGPSYAASIVNNALSKLSRHPLNAKGVKDLWVGVVVYQGEDGEGNFYRASDWFAGEIEALPSWLASRPNPHARIFLANATRAAQFVRGRAQEMGLPEGDDFSEISCGFI